MGWKQKLPVSQLTSFYLIHRKAGKAEKAEKAEFVVKSYILIMDGQKVFNIYPKLEINHSQDIDGMFLTLRCKWMPTN